MRRKVPEQKNATILGRMTAGDGKTCVILPKTRQKQAGDNYRLNKCPCMDPKMKTAQV
jgi:hypothetical protein